MKAVVNTRAADERIPYPVPARPRIDRTPIDLPDAALRALDDARTLPSAGAYRAAGDTGTALVRWYRVAGGAMHTGPRALFWPTLRTAAPASISAALAISLLGASAALGTLGLVGVALGSAVTGIFAHTQYRVERDHHALAALYLASDGTRVLLGRYATLDDRVHDRPRWHVHPIEDLCASHLAGRTHTPRAVLHALGVLGLEPAALAPSDLERVHTLVRLGRRRQRGQSAA